jgi:putative sporulation protein YtaF
MLINSIILAISSSIDSLGIGITYGIKNTKISNKARIILFGISFLVTLISLYFGSIIKNIFNENITKFLGSSILVIMGIFILFQSLKKENVKNNKKDIIYLENETEKIYSFFIRFLGITIKIIKNPVNSDLDNSKIIDSKESLFLGLTLSLDSFCIGIGGSIIGINYQIFPLLIAIFQLSFLSIGNIFGKKLYKLSNLPDNIWSIMSGIILIFIGGVKTL